MTREEAIKELKELRNEWSRHIYSEGVRKQISLDIAIKALEHPEKNVIAVVPCGDAISRSDVLKLMQDNWHTHNGDWAMQESMDDIRALPSVTPQEPDLNKIRAEINKLTVYYTTKDKGINLISQKAVNRILDKYKAESEGE